jgi:hypothetical protein
MAELAPFFLYPLPSKNNTTSKYSLALKFIYYFLRRNLQGGQSYELVYHPMMKLFSRDTAMVTFPNCAGSPMCYKAYSLIFLISFFIDETFIAVGQRWRIGTYIY